MSAYTQASTLKAMFKELIREEIDNNITIRSCIKAKKAVVWSAPNTNKKTVQVKFLADILTADSQPITLTYNPRIESYLQEATLQQTAVSVWYSQSINNGIIMQNADWNI